MAFGAAYKIRDITALTRAERALLDAMRDGKTLAEAAQALGIAPKTAAHRAIAIREKLGVGTIAEAVQSLGEVE